MIENPPSPDLGRFFRRLSGLYRRHRVMLISLFGFTSLLAISSWLLYTQPWSPPAAEVSNTRGFLSDLFVALSASAIWTIAAFFIAANYLRNVDEYSRVDNFPWDREIARANRIDINVHGWDGLFVSRKMKDKRGQLLSEWRETPRAKAWRKFFENGGALRLILPMLPSDQQSAETREKLTTNLTVIAERTGKTLEEQCEEITQTIKLARSLQLTAGKGYVDICHTEELRWICSAKFDDNLILLSTYTTQRRRLVEVAGKVKVVPVTGEFTGPAFAMDPMIYSSIKEWVELLHKQDFDENANQ